MLSTNIACLVQRRLQVGIPQSVSAAHRARSRLRVVTRRARPNRPSLRRGPAPRSLLARPARDTDARRGLSRLAHRARSGLPRRHPRTTPQQTLAPSRRSALSSLARRARYRRSRGLVPARASRSEPAPAEDHHPEVRDGLTMAVRRSAAVNRRLRNRYHGRRLQSTTVIPGARPGRAGFQPRWRTISVPCSTSRSTVAASSRQVLNVPAGPADVNGNRGRRRRWSDLVGGRQATRAPALTAGRRTADPSPTAGAGAEHRKRARLRRAVPRYGNPRPAGPPRLLEAHHRRAAARQPLGEQLEIRRVRATTCAVRGRGWSSGARRQR